MFTITEAAATQIRTASVEGDTIGMPLRVAAKRNEDKSIGYKMGFDDIEPNDVKVSMHETVIIIDPKSHELLDKATMDYVELEEGNFQFIFMNPEDPSYVPPGTNTN